MTKDEAKNFLPLVQALADGKTLQFQKADGTWEDTEIHWFLDEAHLYRIKSEPREWWINFEPQGAFIHTGRKEADMHGLNVVECIHVREVVEP